MLLGLSIQKHISSLLAYSTPIWVYPASIFFKEKFNVVVLVSFILGIVEILIILINNNVISNSAFIGLVLLILASFSWAIAILTVKYEFQHSRVVSFLPWQLLIGSITVLPFAIMLEPHATIKFNLTSVLIFSYIAFAGTTISFLGVMLIIKILPSHVSSIFLQSVSIFGILFSVTMLGEHITLMLYIGMLLVLMGSFVMLIVSPYRVLKS